MNLRVPESVNERRFRVIRATKRVSTVHTNLSKRHYVKSCMHHSTQDHFTLCSLLNVHHAALLSKRLDDGPEETRFLLSTL